MTQTDTQVDVAIVGAGFAGMYLLHRCRQLGLTANVWEAGGDVGGTWYWNRYPGARCDIESVQYSYQFDDALQQEWRWSQHYAPQPEILDYARHVAERFDLRRDIRFDTRVARAAYDAGSWTLTDTDGETLTAQFCVMATGCLSTPNWPDLEGYDRFQGALHHTARWPHEGVDLRGKHVAVIGTGSSGIQSIPQIAQEAASVTVFQRTPNYSIPAHNRPMDPAYEARIKANYADLRARQKQSFGWSAGEFNTGSALDVSAEERTAEYERRWQNGGLNILGAYGDFLQSKAANDTLAQFVHGKIRETVNDPATADLLCPDNIIGGKRLCVDTAYFETYNRENVSLIDLRQTPITTLTETGVQVDGTEYPADVIVIATGFDAMTGTLNKIDIRGQNGAVLRDQWRDGPSSYLGLMMADFPNLFTVTGPGSPSVLSNMLASIEHHVEWISDCIAHVKAQGHQTIAPTARAQTDWWAHVQEVGQTGLKQSTDSWYLGANVKGKPRVFMPYLGGCPAYAEICADVVAKGYDGFAFG